MKAFDNGFRWSVICPDYQKHGFRSLADAERWVSRLKHCAHDHQIVEVPSRTPDDAARLITKWRVEASRLIREGENQPGVCCNGWVADTLKACANELAELP